MGTEPEETIDPGGGWETVKLQQSRLGLIPLVEVHGEVDHSSGRSLHEVTHRALGEELRLLLDLEHCPYMDSGGVAVLLSLLARVRPQGWLGIVSANSDLRRIFTMVGLTGDGCFRCFQSRQQASDAV